MKNAVRALRTEQGTTQEQLGDAMGVPNAIETER
jgi:DNA-binding XRE family transcriptional regulator